MNLGRAISLIRLARGESMRHTAQTAGISLAMLSRIESNKCEPSLTALRKLEISLGCPKGTLAVLAADVDPSDEDALKLIESIKNAEHWLLNIRALCNEPRAAS